MNIIKIPKSDIYDILEDENTQEINSEPYKHDMTFCHYICKKDNKYYAFTLIHSYNNGIELDFDIDATEVAPKEIKTIIWEPVK